MHGSNACAVGAGCELSVVAMHFLQHGVFFFAFELVVDV